VRRFVTTGVVAAAWLASGSAHAAPTSRLIYSRSSEAASCPEEQTLRHEVAARVGYDPFFAWATRTVVAGITRREGAFVATVDLIDEKGMSHGARELHTDGECGELLGAVALAIAIAIDPQSLSRNPSDPEPEPPSPAPAAAPTVQIPTEPHPADTHEAPPPSVAPSQQAFPVFEVSVGAVASAGVAPNLAAGIALGSGIRWRIFSLSLEGRIDAPSTYAAEGGGSVSSWLVLAGPVPCLHYGPLFGCGIGQVGSLQASGTGVPGTHSTSVPWWAAGGRVGALLRLGDDLYLRIRSDVLANFDRATLQLNGAEVWPAPAIATSLGVDALLRF
jgi:hypothetical protein